MARMMIELACLERGARENEQTSGQTLDRIAEDMGVRVTVRRNGALAVQLRVPANLVPPGDGDEVMIENEDAMLSRTS